MSIHYPSIEDGAAIVSGSIGSGDNSHGTAEDKRKRQRRDPTRVRADAVDSARRILADKGPRGVTLQAVARDLGMRHGNLTYHFGSAAGLQSAVLAALGGEVIEAVGAAIRRLEAGDGSEREIVDLVFDAMETAGLIRLVSWLVSTGAVDQIAPMDRAIGAFVGRAERRESRYTEADIAMMALAVLGPAVGAALMGPNLALQLGMPTDSARDLAARQLKALRAVPADVATPRG